jgi:hypothetical protein
MLAMMAVAYSSRSGYLKNLPRSIAYFPSDEKAQVQAIEGYVASCAPDIKQTVAQYVQLLTDAATLVFKWENVIFNKGNTIDRIVTHSAGRAVTNLGRDHLRGRRYPTNEDPQASSEKRRQAIIARISARTQSRSLIAETGSRMPAIHPMESRWINPVWGR